MLAVRRAHRAKSDYAAKGGALWTNGLAVCLAQPKNRRFAVGYVHTHVISLPRRFSGGEKKHYLLRRKINIAPLMAMNELAMMFAAMTNQIIY